jgi:hypothetical protein
VGTRAEHTVRFTDARGGTVAEVRYRPAFDGSYLIESFSVCV